MYIILIITNHTKNATNSNLKLCLRKRSYASSISIIYERRKRYDCTNPN